METIISTIVAALISGGAAIIVSVINANANHKKLLTELEKHDELQAYRLQELEKKQDRHNGYIERTYELEKNVEVIKNDIKVANHRIDDLERKGA